ncbi:MAG: hypothetical protein ABIE74_10200 [Pseudomonadota bacterium]
MDQLKTKNLSNSMLAYLDFQLAWCKPSTVNAYRSNLSHFHTYLKLIFKTTPISKKHLANLSKSQLQNYILYLNNKKLAPYSRVNYLLAVKKYLAWEVEQDSVDESLLSLLDRKLLPKVPEYLPKPLSSQTDQLLIDRWRNLNNLYSKFFLLLRFTGLRISELINLPQDCLFCNHKMDYHHKKTLLRRLSRLHKTLASISFSLKFIPHL